MANQIHQNQSSQNFAPDQTVQTTGSQEGEWMYLQRAAELTSLSEKTLRRYIKKKILKSRRVGKQINSPLQVWITPDSLQTFDAETTLIEETNETEDGDEEILVAEAGESASASSAQERPQIDAAQEVDKIVRAIADQFAQKLDQQKELIFELRNEIQTKDIQLKLLPDLQKQAEEKQIAEFEKIALEKQLAELKLENEKLKTQIEQKQPWWKSFFGAGTSS
jgi:hypothetical protein